MELTLMAPSKQVDPTRYGNVVRVKGVFPCIAFSKIDNKIVNALITYRRSTEGFYTNFIRANKAPLHSFDDLKRYTWLSPWYFSFHANIIRILNEFPVTFSNNSPPPQPFKNLSRHTSRGRLENGTKSQISRSLVHSTNELVFLEEESSSARCSLVLASNGSSDGSIVLRGGDSKCEGREGGRREWATLPSPRLYARFRREATRSSLLAAANRGVCRL